MIPIVQAPHAALSQKAKRINKIDKSITDLIHEMSITLDNTRDPEGVGLAAPQVAKVLQLFIIREDPTAPLLVFINPEIKKYSAQKHNLGDETGKKKKKETGVKLEGCLSLKDIWGVVHRSETITLSYQDEKGVRHEKVFSGFLATIIQHECDHLQGILFPKRVLEQNEKLYKTSIENNETIFEEISV